MPRSENRSVGFVGNYLICYKVNDVLLWGYKMRLVLGSDLHGHLPDVPPCDILVLAGDLLPDTDKQEVFIGQSLRPWLNRAPAQEIVATWGNHDGKPFRNGNYGLRGHWLVDRSAVVMGLKFHGSPWCRPIGRWAWQAPEHIMKYIYSLVPDDVDILLSHTPPYGICDKAKDGNYCGSEELFERMKSLPNLKLLVCGHIHEGRGQVGKVINVACLDENYRLRRDPWTIVDL